MALAELKALPPKGAKSWASCGEDWQSSEKGLKGMPLQGQGQGQGQGLWKASQDAGVWVGGVLCLPVG